MEASFDVSSLQRFVLFVGQPRSGHSVVGALLNASRYALIAHNLDILELVKNDADRTSLFNEIQRQESWFSERNRFLGGYSYQIAGTSVECDSSLQVIGAKKAGAASRHLLQAPDLLTKLRDNLYLPLTCIHHIRNPWDNISSIYTARLMNINRTLQESIDFYFTNVEGAALAANLPACSASFFRTFHEELIADPLSFIRDLYADIGLPCDPSLFSQCAKFVHAVPRATRFSAPWTPDLIQQVRNRMAPYEFLHRYDYSN
jgi:hypothetical protein